MKKPYLTIQHHSGVGQKFKVVDENPFAFLTEALGAIGQFWLPKSEYVVVPNWELVNLHVSLTARVLEVGGVNNLYFALPDNYRWCKNADGSVRVEHLQ